MNFEVSSSRKTATTSLKCTSLGELSPEAAFGVPTLREFATEEAIFVETFAICLTLFKDFGSL